MCLTVVCDSLCDKRRLKLPRKCVQGLTLSLQSNVAVMRQHGWSNVSSDTHDRLVAGLRLTEFGDGVMPQIVKTQPGSRACDLD